MIDRKENRGRKRKDESGINERKTGDAAGDLHALPMTFSMLVNALYNIIDSYFVAQISEGCDDGVIVSISVTESGQLQWSLVLLSE